MNLSVICPVYNNANTMMPMIASFQQQDFGNYEIEFIFICNNCSDNSEELLYSLTSLFPKTFKNCKILHEDFGDVGLARQVGVDNANGEFILFCDMDDWLMASDAFKFLLDNAKSNTLLRFGFDCPKKDWFYIENGRLGYTTYWHVINKMTCTVWRYLFPKSVFEHIHFNGGLKGTDDLDLMIQFDKLENKLPMYITNRILYWWNYMDPRSQSYAQMIKRTLLNKEQFLDICSRINQSDEMKEELKHLL